MLQVVRIPLLDMFDGIRQSAPSISVIGLSVRNDREAEEAMRQAGESGYLTKESAAEQLHQAICELLQRATPPGH